MATGIATLPLSQLENVNMTAIAPGVTNAALRRTVLTVLGARSGTSALAGTFGIIGCALPKNLIAANWANTKGYFEPSDIAALHDDMLASIGSIWSDYREFPASWIIPRRTKPSIELCRAGPFGSIKTAEIDILFSADDLGLMLAGHILPSAAGG